MTRGSGFTLIEILAALAVLALMSALAYRGLDSVLETRARLEREGDKWRSLSVAFLELRQSLDAAVVTAPFIGEPEAFFFVRAGLENAQRVGYRLNGARLEQVSWPTPYPAAHSAALAVPLIHEVKSVALRYRSPEGAWQENWPARAERAAPVAIAIQLELARGETLTRFFALP